MLKCFVVWILCLSLWCAGNEAGTLTKTIVMNTFKEVQVNGLWMFAIVNECALNYKTGLNNRAGSPFAQFRSKFNDCPKNKEKALLWIDDLLTSNDIKKPGLFSRTVSEIRSK